jgi:hypothetical protein
LVGCLINVTAHDVEQNGKQLKTRITTETQLKQICTFGLLVSHKKKKMHYKLIRQEDGLVKQSKDVKWIEFNEAGTFKKAFKAPKKGRSLLMSPFNAFFTWQTTDVVKIIEKTETMVHFKTKNSEYKLSKEEN